MTTQSPLKKYAEASVENGADARVTYLFEAAAQAGQNLAFLTDALNVSYPTVKRLSTGTDAAELMPRIEVVTLVLESAVAVGLMPIPRKYNTAVFNVILRLVQRRKELDDAEKVIASLQQQLLMPAVNPHYPQEFEAPFHAPTLSADVAEDTSDIAFNDTFVVDDSEE